MTHTLQSSIAQGSQEQLERSIELIRHVVHSEVKMAYGVIVCAREASELISMVPGQFVHGIHIRTQQAVYPKYKIAAANRAMNLESKVL